MGWDKGTPKGAFPGPVYVFDNKNVAKGRANRQTSFFIVLANVPKGPRALVTPGNKKMENLSRLMQHSKKRYNFEMVALSKKKERRVHTD